MASAWAAAALMNHSAARKSANRNSFVIALPARDQPGRSANAASSSASDSRVRIGYAPPCLEHAPANGGALDITRLGRRPRSPGYRLRPLDLGRAAALLDPGCLAGETAQ